MVVMSENQFLASKGVSFATSGYCLDKLRSNRQLRTERGKKRFEAECIKAEAEYQQKRAKAKAEYASLVEKGEIRPETTLEARIRTAHGHEDLAATHAARRLLAKKGIDWKTGKPF